MAFIKVQKLVRDEEGNVRSGSAAIVVSEYDPAVRGRSRHRVRERLGKIVTLDGEGKSGVFLSPTRGLVAYDSVADAFSDIESGDGRVEGLGVFAEPEIHTVFGDSYLLLRVLEKSGLLAVLRTAFQKDRDYERVLAHVMHSVLRDGSRIGCDDFIAKSFASYLLDDIPVGSLGSDTAYFSMMGEDSSRLSFFRAFVARMRKADPLFGEACYVDSTPLPNDIDDNPFNYLCSHGVRSTSVQMRLVLVLDERSGLPVWYTIIAGNLLDLSTLENTLIDVAESLDVKISSFVLDAGYASAQVLKYFHSGEGAGKSLTVRMPPKNGYPYKSLYHKARPLMANAKHEFIRAGHTYFAKRYEIEVLEVPVQAYVYVDKDNALSGSRNWRLAHEDEYEKLTDTEKNWLSVRFGFFVLISTETKGADELLDDYFGRTSIESVFKTSKEYLDLLPLSKWSNLTVRGKILSDIVATIALLQLRKLLAESGISTCRLFGRTQSLMCTKKRDGTVIVEVANKQAREFYQTLKVKVPSSVDLAEFKLRTLGLKSKGA